MVRYLNPANHNSRRITKADKDFAKRFDFKDKKLPVKARDIQKIEKKKILLGLAFLVVKFEILKVKFPISVSKICFEDKHIDLLLIGEGEKKHYVLIKYFNTFMYNHTLHRGKKDFCRYCL